MDKKMTKQLVHARAVQRGDAGEESQKLGIHRSQVAKTGSQGTPTKNPVQLGLIEEKLFVKDDWELCGVE